MPEALAARIAPEAPVLVRAEPTASAAVIFRAVAEVTGTPLEAVPGDSMDPVRATTAIVAPPACGLAAADSIVAAEVFEAVAPVVVAVASEVAAVVVAVVEAAVAGKRCES